ncbi:tetratricopeptide repeat-containing sensor histidine kinase [Litoribacter ruber]|uniref:tetratricopeptide repeat-containing sensor histidine kinase n=1 Tax=Litoribacter ruber TaxID=702568 RepID=UPI001BDA40C1|nr:tetratricopeptide repeat-containing sensor histidine kinase [Litoribacter ruber]MBT0810414.1 tetratricopeptide repeat-containing sensor histidine kinase [Litoribacter ruber]
MKPAFLLLLCMLSSLAFAQIPDTDPQELYEQIQQEKDDHAKLRLLSDFAWLIHNTDSSQKFYKEAIQLSLVLNEADFLVQNYNRIGVVFRNLDLHERALEYYEYALVLSKEIGNKKEEGYALNNIAQILNYQGHPTEALEYYKEAERIFKSIDHQEGLGYTYIGFSAVYNKLERYIDAIQAIDKSMEIRGNHIDRNYLTSILFRGDFFLKLKDFDRAYQDYELYFEHVKGNYTRGEMTAFKRFAEWHYQNGNTRQAMEYAHKALEIHQHTPSLEAILSIYYLMAEIYSSYGQYDKAFEYQQAYIDGKDQLLDERTNSYLTNLKIRRQEAEIKSLELDRKIQEEQASKKKLINIGLLFLLFLSGCMIFIYYRSYQQERLNLAKLNAQKQEIASQAEELKNLNMVKDKLFSILAHDLRGPLNSLRGLIQLIEEEDLTEQEFREILPLISQNVGNNSILLENLLMWSRSQMKGMRPLKQTVRIKSIFDDNEDHLNQIALQKNIRLVNVIDDSVLVKADRGMIDIVMRNLLTNALKFTPEGGEISVEAEDLGKSWKILISDSGVGIAAENMDQIFGTNFYTTVGTKKEKGSGLGLLLSKELIEKNNGTISLNSVEGEGTTFYFTLPKA